MGEKTSDFKLLEAKTPRELEKMVNDHLAAGFRLHGHVEILGRHDSEHYEDRYFQAVYKYEYIPDQYPYGGWFPYHQPLPVEEPKEIYKISWENHYTD